MIRSDLRPWNTIVVLPLTSTVLSSYFVQLTRPAFYITFLVPGNSDVNATMEFNHIQDWAKHNSMIINLGKTKEIIFYNPRAIPSLTPLPIFGIEQVSSAKLLGVYIQGNFSCDMHFKPKRLVAWRVHHVPRLSRCHTLDSLRHGGFCKNYLHFPDCRKHALAHAKLKGLHC